MPPGRENTGMEDRFARFLTFFHMTHLGVTNIGEKRPGRNSEGAYTVAFFALKDSPQIGLFAVCKEESSPYMMRWLATPQIYDMWYAHAEEETEIVTSQRGAGWIVRSMYPQNMFTHTEVMHLDENSIVV
jgi:hypothetical protein